jgi:hypothetical protein
MHILFCHLRYFLVKRRDFIVGVTGVAGATYIDVATFAAPCNPSLSGSVGAPICPTPTGTTDLASLANQLGPGESISFPAGNQSRYTQNDLEWQSNFYHDVTTGRIHLMGKPANANSSWRHQYYSMANGSWTSVTSGISGWNYFGHIYGNNAIDESTGDLYQVVGGLNSNGDTRKAWRYRRGTGIWDSRAPVNGTFTSGSMNDTANGAAWHPHLFGQNDGGLVIDQQISTLYWRKSDDSMQEVGHSSNTFGRKEGVGIYWPAADAVFVGGSDGGALAKIDRGSGSTPNRITLNRPPIHLEGSSSTGSGFGSLHVHPGNPNKLLIVETVGRRAWTSTDGNSWTQVSNHPFGRFPRVVCSLRANLNCLWAVGNDGGNFSELWKPAP